MRPVRLLFASSTFSDYQPLRVDEEFRVLKARMRHLEESGRVVLLPCLAVRLDDLIDATLRERPDVIHLSCHGEATEVFLEDDERGQLGLPIERLGRLLQALNSPTRLLVLNTCSSINDNAVCQAFPAPVIFFNDKVTDESAIRFSATFYMAAGNGASIRQAFEIAKLSLEIVGGEPIPQLVSPPGSHSADLPLFSPADPLRDWFETQLHRLVSDLSDFLFR